MTRSTPSTYHLLLLPLLFLCNIALALPFPAHTSKGTTGKTTQYVKQYTLTEPDTANGKSWTSDKYHEYGNKLFVNPNKHDPSPSKVKEKTLEYSHKFHNTRELDEDTYERKTNRHIAAGHALEGISNGLVVRHTSNKKTMLLHHTSIGPHFARALHHNDHVMELFPNKNKFHYTESRGFSRHQSVNQRITPGSAEDRKKMNENLERIQSDAQKHQDHLDMTPKRYWNKDTLSAEPDANRERELKMAKQKKKFASTSSPKQEIKKPI